MAKNLKRLVVWMLTICMLIGVMAIPAMAEDGDTPKMYFERGTASNISYMLISKSGDVEFVKKIDIGKETSVPIITKDGYISAMFIKQSTSGMFWFSEEIEDQYIIDETIECLKDNNPSYKGYGTIAFGEGSHDLQYKKNKVVTYIFDSIEVEEEPEVPVEPEETQPEETQPEATEPVTPDIPVVDAPEMPGNAETGTGTATKTAVSNGETYTVEIQVPGKDGDNRFDDVILMVDGSYSMDNEWPAMKEAITTIGETVLNGSGNTRLTLMAFGMGDNYVLQDVTNATDLANALGTLPGNLLYGRSSTNCEAGFTGVAEHIASRGTSLKDAYVIFISDGNVNTDETPRAFDANWQTWTKFGALAVAQETFGGTVSNGTNLPAAFTTIFGDRFDGATSEEIITRAFGTEEAAAEVTDDEFIAFAEQVWTDVYAYSGLTRGEEYPVSTAERAFVKYDKENGTYIQDLFYYTTYKSAYVTYNDRWTRTPAAADALAAMEQVKAMYVVDYDSYTSWMDTGITSEKSTFVQSNGIAGLCEALDGALGELAKTPFNDVIITDYMSKWVNLDPTTLRIVDNSTGETVWTVNGGWTIDNPPTAAENPVVISEVDPSEYVLGGTEVEGNESGKIYKLTWYVKDGAMVRSDTYSLKYEVTADTAEAGFKYNENLPANGNTDLFYKDENGNDMTNEIAVPTVKVEKEIPAVKDYVVTFESGSASHICFLYVNRETGEIVYESKYDFDDNDTSATIPGKEGYISVVFIKQAQSGILWTAEEVDADTEAALIASVEANDPAYKGCDAVVSGEGSHDLTYTNNGKKYHTVTYNFA